MRRRTNDFHIRLNDAEMEALNKMVSRAGISREKFVRKLIAGCKIHEAPPVDFFTLIRELNRIGSNIDQILKVANTRCELEVPELKQCLTELVKLESQMWKTFMPGSK